jgi:hypothetical protein
MEQSQQPKVAGRSVVLKQQGIYLSPAFMQARESYWTALQSRLVYIGCGDDRGPTEASIQALIEGKDSALMSPEEGYASIYGATAGLAKNVLVVGAAQFGADFITTVGGFDGVMQLLVSNSSNLQSLHSAEGNEHDQWHFSFEGAAPVGCAYAAGVGATAALLVGSSSVIRDIAKAEQQHVFGDTTGFGALLRGQQAFLDHATKNQKADFAINRDLYKQYKQQFDTTLQIMILAGNHADAKMSGVISSFSLTEVGSPVKAHQGQLDFYRLDIAIVTETVLQALTSPLKSMNTDYELSPDLLMRAIQLDSTPVRAVLASRDSDPELQGKLDPLNLKMGVRGNPFESLKIIRERQTAGYYS